MPNVPRVTTPSPTPSPTPDRRTDPAAYAAWLDDAYAAAEAADTRDLATPMTEDAQMDADAAAEQSLAYFDRYIAGDR